MCKLLLFLLPTLYTQQWISRLLEISLSMELFTHICKCMREEGERDGLCLCKKRAEKTSNKNRLNIYIYIFIYIRKGGSGRLRGTHSFLQSDRQCIHSAHNVWSEKLHTVTTAALVKSFVKNWDHQTMLPRESRSLPSDATSWLVEAEFCIS